jgi:hypothetical protein
VNDLELSFTSRGLVRGNELFLKAEDALAFIEAARSKGMKVHGIETFGQHGRSTFCAARRLPSTFGMRSENEDPEDSHAAKGVV